MARSLTEALTETARAPVGVRDWERDQEAWNLPRARGGSLAREAGKAGVEPGEGDPGERGSDPPVAPGTTE